jgi:hypothetical protein
MIKAMPSIPHFDQMTAKEYQALFSPDGLVEMTEKYDGSNVSFGVNENGDVYLKTKKGAPITDEALYFDMAVKYNNDVFKSFGELLQDLKKDSIKKLLSDHKDVQIFCEFFSKSQMNVITYNPFMIGEGALVILSIMKNGENIIDKYEAAEIEEDLTRCIAFTSGRTVYGRSTIKMSMVESMKAFFGASIYDQNTFSILTSRKRTGPIFEKKKALQENFKQNIKEIKGRLLEFLKNQPSSLGASRIEGAVLRNTKTRQMAKLVDLEEFGKERERQWAGIGALRKYRSQLFDRLYTNVFGDADIFVMKEKMHQKLFEAIELNGDRFDHTEDMLLVLFKDADREINYPIIEDERIVEILKEHSNKVGDALSEVDANDSKAVVDTSNAVYAERNAIVQLLSKSITYSEFYASLIEFILGPRLLRELQDKYVKTLNNGN